jgi:hypothetical protein
MEETIRPWLAVAYGWAMIAGLAGLVWTPQTIEGTIGWVVTTGAAAMAAVGGLLSTVSVLARRWRIERVVIHLVSGGIGAYAAGVWSIVLGDSAWSRMMQGAIVLSTISMFLVRARWIEARARLRRQAHHQYQEAIRRVRDEPTVDGE